jgi:hypothetical protein
MHCLVRLSEERDLRQVQREYRRLCCPAERDGDQPSSPGTHGDMNGQPNGATNT